MAFILDEANGLLLDEALGFLFDELGEPVPVDAEVLIAFQSCTSVSAQATMEFTAGSPVQAGLTTIASDSWLSMYPG